MPERDQWGETPDERQSRIFKRDLAWFTCAEGHARDGVPCAPRDRLHFNEGYDAGRTDYVSPLTDHEIALRELHHFEAEKALTGLAHLADALDADGQPSIATAIRSWLPADVLPTHSNESEPEGVSDVRS